MATLLLVKIDKIVAATWLVRKHPKVYVLPAILAAHATHGRSLIFGEPTPFRRLTDCPYLRILIGERACAISWDLAAMLPGFCAVWRKTESAAPVGRLSRVSRLQNSFTEQPDV